MTTQHGVADAGHDHSVAIRCVIVDDDAASRRRVRLALESHSQFTVVGEFASGLEALAAIPRLHHDLLFLDVRMPGMDGFELLRRLGPAGAHHVIFMTAHDEHAVRAFEVNALDYLLKPYTIERFDESLRRAASAVAQSRALEFSQRIVELLSPHALDGSTPHDADPPATPPSNGGTFTIREAGILMPVPIQDIDWVAAEGDYARLHAGKNRYLQRVTMNAMEKILEPAGFVRIHRSTLVRVGFIREVRPQGVGRLDAILKDGTRRHISSAGRERLAAVLGI